MTTTEQSAADKMSEKPATATAPAAASASAVATPEVKQKLSESDDFTEDSADNTADAAREDTSQQSGLATVESEYDTASDSPSDGEEEYDDQEEDDGEESGESGESGEEEEEDEEEELGSETDGGSDDDVIEVHLGDGQEQEGRGEVDGVEDDEEVAGVGGSLDARSVRRERAGSEVAGGTGFGVRVRYPERGRTAEGAKETALRARSQQVHPQLGGRGRVLQVEQRQRAHAPAQVPAAAGGVPRVGWGEQQFEQQWQQVAIESEHDAPLE